MSTNQFYDISKDKIDEYLNDFAKLINKRKPKGFHSEIVIVGGASILLNYGFRFNSNDIDCSDRGGILMNDIINEIANKHNLPSNWINTDFIATKSYSNKLDQYSKYYKTYGYGALDVRTIKDEYLVAMKIVSARKYKNDYSDIFGIINECKNKGEAITFKMINKAIIDLYGTIDVVDKDTFEFTKKVIEQPELFNYESIREQEKQAMVSVIEMNNDDNLDSEDIEYILKKIKFMK